MNTFTSDGLYGFSSFSNRLGIIPHVNRCTVSSNSVVTRAIRFVLQTRRTSRLLPRTGHFTLTASQTRSTDSASLGMRCTVASDKADFLGRRLVLWKMWRNGLYHFACRLTALGHFSQSDGAATMADMQYTRGNGKGTNSMPKLERENARSRIATVQVSNRN